MNRPEGISESAWAAAEQYADELHERDDYMHFESRKVLSRAIQSSVEAERERAAKICETVGKRLEGREFSGNVLEVAVREAVNEATHNACVILAKHIRKGA